MKKAIALTLLLSSFSLNSLIAEEIPRDTLRIIDVEEIVVIATPKENRKLRELPNAVSLISQKEMQANQVNSLKNITALVPNIFIPDYGSKLTSAIYIRGVGSRINTPSVGLYVDNVPFIDKSAFDFDYSDIERIDVLRGPQSTLYGRNAMGGLIRVYTKSPFSYQGTDVKLRAATYGNMSTSLTHYHRISEKFAFSAGGFYEYADGFFKNSYKDNKKIDRSNAGGGRIRGIYLPSDNLKLDLNVSYEYSDQGGYAYGLYDKETGKWDKPAYNEDNTYYRGLFNSSLNLEYQADKFIFSSVTGFQNLKDRMFIDQDFTPADFYTIAQKQKQHTITEEVTFKSKGNRRWDWVTGAFGFYQGLKTNAPVTFRPEGVTWLEGIINEGMQGSGMPGTLNIVEDEMFVPGKYDTPSLGLALFHQSTINNFIFPGLSATVGLRLDYEKMKMTHHTSADITFQTIMGGKPIDMPMSYPIEGKEKDDYFELLPKFALKYEFNPRNNVYASVTRGYRSGGYNLQMFSDLIQKKMRTTRPGVEPEEIEVKDIQYKPEYTWSYEVGSHLTLWQNRLWMDLSAFLMNTEDQQIARFAESGLGRMMENAGTSRSYGIEAALRSQLTEGLTVNLNYGYTHATFRKYDSNMLNENGELMDLDYSGNYVPFVPMHTFSANGQYTWKFGNRKGIRELTCNLGYTGAGKIYWTEVNDVSQSFYGTVNTRISASAGPVQVDLWGQNIFDKKYATFYFESMQKGFMQRGKPAQFGIDVRLRF